MEPYFWSGFLIQALAIAAISLTISKSPIFQPIRDWPFKWPIFNELFSCYYCLSHWLAFVAAFIYARGALTIVVYAFALVAAAAIIGGVMIKLLMWHEGEILYLKRKIESLEKEHED